MIYGMCAFHCLRSPSTKYLRGVSGAARLLKETAMTTGWRSEVREWEKVGRGGGRCVYGAAVVLVEMAYTGRLPAFEAGKGGDDPSSDRARGGGC